MSTNEFDYIPPLFSISSEYTKIESSDIEKWENKNKIILPISYRNFILATNGGSIKPYAFSVKLNDDEIPDTTHCIKNFYPLISESESVEVQEIDTENQKNKILKIANTTSGFDIVMSLDKNNLGEIFALSINSLKTNSEGQEVWELIKVSESFLEFIHNLKNDDSGSTYHPIWQSPSHETQDKLRNSKKLIEENGEFKIT